MLEIAAAAVPLELKNPFTLAHGSSFIRHNVFVRLRRDGYEAWGEAAVVPYYHIDAAMIIEDLRRYVTALQSGREVALAYSMSSNAFHSALLGLEVLSSGIDERSLLHAEDGPYDEPSSYTVAYDPDIGKTLALIEASPFRTIKVKGGFGDDGARLRAIRSRFASHTIYVDANQGWSFEQAKRTIDELSELDIAVIEEPMKGSPEAIKVLSERSPIPILLDETIQTEQDLLTYHQSISGVVVKNAKSGGPKRSRALIERAHALGLDVMLSCMVESSIAITYAAGLAGLCRWLDLDGPLLLHEDMGTPIGYVDGRVRASVRALVPTDALRRHFVDALTWEVAL